MPSFRLNREALAEREVVLLRAIAWISEAVQRGWGLTLAPQSDFFELRRVVRAHALDRAKLAPMYDEVYGDGRRDVAFWLAGLDRKGDVVATIASRLYDWVGSNAQDEIESGRAFTKLVDLAQGVRMIVPDVARQVAGIVVHDGAMWVRDDFRTEVESRHLSHYLSRAGRFYALLRWQFDWAWSLMDRKLVDAGVHLRCGYQHSTVGTAAKWPSMPTRRGHFLSITGPDTFADAERVARGEFLPIMREAAE